MTITIARKLGIAAILAAFTFSAMPADAGSKPRGAKPANPQMIIKLFAGNTWVWSKGGLFTGRDGKAQAVWEENIGSGTWSVTTKGTLCRTLIWQWVGEGGKEGSEPKKQCNQHVVDKDGVLWQRHHEDNDWYRLMIDEKIQPKNKIKSLYRKIERRIS